MTEYSAPDSDGGASLHWEEARSLADLLAALDEQVQASDPLPNAPLPDMAMETTRHLAAMFQAQVMEVAQRMDAALCALYLADPPATRPADAARRRASQNGRFVDLPGEALLSLRALYGASWNANATRLGVPLPPGGPATRTLLSQMPLTSTDADLPMLSEATKARQVRRWLYVPIFGQASPWSQHSRTTRPLRSLADKQPSPSEPARAVLGVLAVGRTARAADFTPADTLLLSALGEQVVWAIENARLSEQASLARELGRRCQTALERLAQREQIIEELHEGVLLLDPGGQVLQLNARGQELLGWPAPATALVRVQNMDAIQFRSAQGDLLPIEDWPMFRVLRGQSIKQEEFYYTGLNLPERLLVFSGQPLWDARGQLAQGLLNFHEASSEQVARAQLTQIIRMSALRAHYVGAVLEAVTDGIIVCNRDGTVLLVNPAGLRILGIEGRRIVPGQYHLSQFIADFKVRALNGKPLAVDNFPVMRALRGETVRDVELKMRRPDNDHDWRAQVSAAPVKERPERSHVLGAVAVLVDVTEARALEEAKDEFLARSAHELRNPLAAIRGFAQLLRRGARRAPQGIERRADMHAVEKIEAQTERLSRLVEELTDAARAQLGKFDLNLRPVPLAALLRRVAEAEQVTSERHKIMVDAPESGLFVTGDEGRLEQVFHNLVANAIKYSPSGSEISISVTSVTDPASAAAFVEVAVRDQGQGIAPGDLERVFERFRRAEAVRAKTQGLGLGLYIARAIVEAHGGTLRAESEGLGKGSTFIARLPYQT